MKVDAFRRLQQGDYQDAQPWWFRALDPINKQFEKLTNAMRKGLDFGSNFNGQVKTLELAHDTSTEIKVDVRGKPLGVLILGTNSTDYARVAWEIVDAEKVAVKVKWDTDPGALVEATLLIIGGGE